MASPHPLIAKHRIILWLSLLLAAGFLGTSLASYHVSRAAIHESILGRELPLTSDNIYSEIQKDLIRPVFISSMMASDTFLRDWVLGGEVDVDRVTRYLAEVKARYGAFTSFFVSERTGLYYHASGVLKQVHRDEPRDAWYYRVRELQTPYEINVDSDQANRDALTIFVNYRVLDYQGRFIGVAGIGLTVDAVRKLIGEYQERYHRHVYFVTPAGRIILFGNQPPFAETDIRQVEGLKGMVAQLLSSPAGSHDYRRDGREHLLNVRLVPELNWYLFVEKAIDEDLATARHTLYANLAISAAVTVVVLLLATLTINRYQRRLEEMATTDGLTGLMNRQAAELLFARAAAEHRRQPFPLALLLLDIDHFKAINDRHGHPVGDRVIQAVAGHLRSGLRESDLAARWGGEEFLVLLRGCEPEAALAIADKLRARLDSAPVVVDGREIPVTVSIGVAGYHAGDNPDTALSRVDAALYAAKAAGRNRSALAPATAAV